MRKLWLVLLLMISGHIVVAQKKKAEGQVLQQNLNELARPNNLYGVVDLSDNRYEGVRGTPFFNDNWGTATISIKDVVFDNVSVKYNVYDNKLLYNTDGRLMELDLDNVTSFDLKDSLGLHTYHFRKINSLTDVEHKLNEKFAIVLHDGDKSKLLRLPSKRMIKADFKGTYSSGITYDELVNEEDIYFINTAGELQKVKLNKRNLTNLLNDKKQQIASYIESEKINTETMNGWGKVLAYYETL